MHVMWTTHVWHVSGEIPEKGKEVALAREKCNPETGAEMCLHQVGWARKVKNDTRCNR